MEQIIAGVSARNRHFARAAAASVADVMRSPVWAAASGSSSFRSQRSMSSACCSRPGTGTGPWAHTLPWFRERWPWCIRRSMRGRLRMSLRVRDGRLVAPLKSPSIAGTG